jgi:Rad3-related DNA helicase
MATQMTDFKTGKTYRDVNSALEDHIRMEKPTFIITGNTLSMNETIKTPVTKFDGLLDYIKTENIKYFFTYTGEVLIEIVRENLIKN